jgi:hypothetical protein
MESGFLIEADFRPIQKLIGMPITPLWPVSDIHKFWTIRWLSTFPSVNV